MVARLALAGALAALAGGCQCGFDAGKLDDLGCRVSSDCRPDQDCLDETCTQRHCVDVSDCGDAARFECRDGFCDAPPCDAAHPCEPGYGCGGGFCIPGLPDGGAGDAGLDAAVPCGGPAECDDSLECTDDSCEEGFCVNDPRPGFCAIDGACWGGGDVHPDNPCQLCQPTASATRWTADDARAPNDGIDCTIDRCLGGQPSFEPQDGLCGGGVCSVCAGGCVEVPTLTIDCPDLPGTAGGAPVACSVTATPAPAGDAGCLSCTTVVGITSLVREDFTDCPDLEDIGWGGDLRGLDCPTGRDLGPNTDQNVDALRMGDNRVSLERWFDTSQFDAARLCFDVASGNDNELGLSLELNASGVWNEIWSQDAPGAGRNSWQLVCLDLVAFDPLAAGNPSVGVRFRGNQQGNWGGDVYLDDIAIDGWVERTIARPGPVVSDDFAACALADWSVQGDAPDCPFTSGLLVDQEALGARNSSWTIARDVDLFDRCDDVRVGFSLAAHGPDDNERLRVRVDQGPGLQLVWGLERGPRPDDVFAPFEIPLSTIDPAVRFASPLNLSLQVDSQTASDSLMLDDVWVDGAQCLPAEDLVVAAAPVLQEPGLWSLDVAGTARGTAHVHCIWDGRANVTARRTVQYCADPECAPGERETQACGQCGTQVRQCDSDCRWFDWSNCADRPCSCCDAYGSCSPCCC